MVVKVGMVLAEDKALICATKEPMLWTALIRNHPYKATCHLFAVRFAVRPLVMSATCMCMYKCTHGKSLTAVACAGNAAALPADSRSTSGATQEKNLSVARFAERASHRWLT